MEVIPLDFKCLLLSSLPDAVSLQNMNGQSLHTCNMCNLQMKIK